MKHLTESQKDIISKLSSNQQEEALIVEEIIDINQEN